MNDEKIELPDLGDRTVIETINKKDMVPLYENDHEHVYIRDEEETDDYYAEICQKCPVGRLVAKT